MKFVDFHIHTSASDGSLSPEEVVAEAARASLSSIGITDHDTMDGLLRARAAGKRLNVEIIPGIEFSTHLKNAEIHILGYFCQEENIRLSKTIGRLKSDRYTRMEKMVYKLNRLGVRISFSEVLAEVKGKAVGRPHLARVLCKKGYCNSMEEAFAKYIGYHSPAYVKRKEFSPAEAIEIIHGAGGISVLAHPGSYGNMNFLPLLLRKGLMGIEVFHPRNTVQVSYRYIKLALKCGLIITGGSDYHGDKRGEGVQIGAVKMEEGFLQEIKRRCRLLNRQQGRF